jgi:molecular chaperone HtpG
MKEMNQLGGGASFYGTLPDMYNLVVNTSHPLIEKIIAEKNEEKQQDLIQQTTDLALLAKGLLSGEELSKFIKRSLNLIHNE